MKKQLWIVSFVVSGTFLLAQGLPAGLPAKDQPARAADAPAAASSPSAAKGKTPDRAAAYYHFALAHMYEEQVATYGRSELANKAIEEYRAAIDADPTSAYLTSGLAELYAKTGRIRDAVVEAQDIIKRNPNNLEADHAARAIWELVGRLDLSGFKAEIESVEGAAGRPAYDPQF